LNLVGVLSVWLSSTVMMPDCRLEIKRKGNRDKKSKSRNDLI